MEGFVNKEKVDGECFYSLSEQGNEYYKSHIISVESVSKSGYEK